MKARWHRQPARWVLAATLLLARTVEAQELAPTITAHPQSQTVAAASAGTFNVTATGTEPLCYQWRKDGTILAEGARITGVTTSTLTIANVQSTDWGLYSVAVTNSFGAATSLEAQLTLWPLVAWGLTNYTVLPAGLTKVATIAAGSTDTLALRDDGTVVQWAGNGTLRTNLPARLSGVVAVAGGPSHSLALCADGTVVAWGSGAGTNVPAGLTDVAAIAVGTSHSLALQRDGTVAAWGTGSATNVPPGLRNVVAITAGSSHSLVLRDDGTLSAWGSGSATNVPAGLTTAVAIAAHPASTYSLVLQADGTVLAWGANSYGATNVPVGLTDVAALAAGGAHGIALRSDGTVVSWGLASVTNSPAGLSNVVALAAGSRHGVALQGDGRPCITVQPMTHRANAGTPALLTVKAVGAPPLSFQWQFNGTNLADATHATLLLPAVEFTASGVYQCIVSNPSGVVVSREATLTVAPLTFEEQPKSQTVLAGTTASFHVAASGLELNYQWRKDGITLADDGRITGAHTATLTISNLQLEDAGSYSVLVSNAFGVVTSPPATLAVPPLLITTEPESQAAGALSNVTFRVVVSGPGPFSYQWRKAGADLADGGSIVGAQTATLILSNVQPRDAGVFTVVVQNVFGAVPSREAILTVAPMAAWGNNSGGQTRIPLDLTNVVAITAGGYHNLALLDDRTIRAWGLNLYGQTNVPPGLTNVTAMAAGFEHSLALTADGAIHVWGYSPTTNVPPGLTDVSAIAACGHHSLALRRNGTVVSWGDRSNTPPALSNVVAIAAGYSHDVVLLADGRVAAWGALPQANVPFGLSNVVAIAAGLNHTLALKAEGTVVAWGQSPANNVPPGLSDVVAIAAGSGHSLALRADGTMVAWGDNASGQTNVPAGASDLVAIAAGYVHSLVLTSSRYVGASSLVSWGCPPTVPRILEELTDVVAISAGGSHSLVLKAGGTVAAWTRDEAGDNRGQATIPAGLSQVIAIAAGGLHSLALKDNGTVVGWGGNISFNDSGREIYTGQATVPTGLREVVAIAAGGYHSLALKADGSVVGWGANHSYGEEEEYLGQASVPFGLSRVVAIAAGRYHSLALKADGTVVAWGEYTQPYDSEDGPTGWNRVPAGLTNVVAIAAGDYNSLALKSDGTVVAWGGNWHGQANVPSNLVNVVAIAAGDAHSLALKADATVVAWGANSSGQASVPPALRNAVAIAAGWGYSLALKGRPQPVLVVPPRTRNAYSGTTVLLQAGVLGRLPLSYQWQRNGTNIPGATNALLALTGLQSSDAGSYSVVASNSFGAVSSPQSLLTVFAAAPVIVVAPADQEACAGGTVRFQISAEGSEPLLYQWRFEGADIPGATNELLALANVTSTSVGAYSVALSNAYGYAASPSAALRLVPVPVVAWGENYFGQTALFPSLTNAVAIAAGGLHSLALKADGTVVGWGAYSIPRHIAAGLTNMVAIAAGMYHSLALKADGTVVEWGGDGDESIPPDVAAGLTNVVAIAAGYDHSLALRRDGTVAAWGCSWTNWSWTSWPVPAGLTNVVGIAAGWGCSLALKGDGTVVAWNDGWRGQASIPGGLSNVVAVAAGYNHSLALKRDGTVIAWRGNWYGSTEVASNLVNVVAIAAGGWGDNLALKSDGTIVAWNDGWRGQTNLPRDLTNVVAIAAGGDHSLALLADGSPVSMLRPVAQAIVAGNPVSFTSMLVGHGPFGYQWQFNGSNLAGATNRTLTLPHAELALAGDYTVVVSNALGVVTSQVAQLTVLVPPSFDPLPASATALLGSNVTFTVDATGTPPLHYQWRKNGVNIPSATNSWLTITNVQVSDGGSYSVVVANIAGTVTSDPMLLIVEVPQVPPGDDFTNRVAISGWTNSVGGTNRWATREDGEPYHAGKHGSNSVWYAWTAPASGIATFRTVGSTFDTLLGVYTGNNLTELMSIAEDEDRGGYLTSEARFNAVDGVEYQIAIDGFAGQQGTFILSWQLETTAEVIPVMTNQPVSQTVVPGGETTFSVGASGTGLTYQWYLDGGVMADATNASLTLTNVTEADVGFYAVWVRNRDGREVESLPGALEIGSVPRWVGVDKLEDLFDESGAAPAPLHGGGKEGSAGFAAPSPSGFISVSMGTIDYQIANTTNAQSQSWEPNHCGILGGASVWYDFEAEDAGTLAIDTMGSRFDTVLAVYRRTNLVNLAANNVACDNDSAPDGVSSRVVFETPAGARYWVVVDGVNAARGRVKLNWCLGRAPEVASVWTNAVVARGNSVTLRVGVSNAVPAAQYQWHWNGQAVPGATNRTLVLTNVQAAQAGYYSVVVSNAIATVLAWVAGVELEPVWVPTVQHGFAGGGEDWAWGTEAAGGGASGSGWQAGGYLEVRASHAGETWWWRAPRHFSGNSASAYRGWLQFDLKQTTGWANRPVVRLLGAGITLVNRLTSPPGTNWTAFRVSLWEETGWQRADGTPAFPGELWAVLANLEALQIEGQFGAATDACDLDNVQFLAPCTDDPPPLRIGLEGSPAQTVLAWPAEAGCFQLEATTNLGSPTWTTNFTVVSSVLTNGWQRMTMDSTVTNRFFRLKKE